MSGFDGMSTNWWIVAAPEIVLLGLICVVLVVDLFIEPEKRAITFWLSIATLGVTLYAV